MRIKKESELLDQATRKAIIDEIRSDETKRRKAEFYRRHMAFKDHTFRYVLEQLLKQFSPTTVEEMSYAVSNISFSKKIIKKLARVYNNGVKRTATSKDGKALDKETKMVEENAKLLQMNTQMKKVNRYLRLQHNITAQICPVPVDVNGVEKYKLAIKVLQPFFYDVVENFYDREQPMAYILSNYQSIDTVAQYVPSPATEGRSTQAPKVVQQGDGKDGKIADAPEDSDADRQEFIWWSDKYHFTTNGKGEIINVTDQNKENLNPIGELPFENFAIDQDNSFWAIGGKDVVDSDILINSLITNVVHIGVTQGYGQFWMKGEKVPRTVMLGPNKAVLMEYKKDEAVPDIGFASANPPLEQLRNLIEMYIALALTTNNLSTSGISAQLAGGKDFASGIALMIDKSESTEDVEEQAQIFHDKEPILWRKYQKVQGVYASRDLLVDDYKEYLLPEDLNVGLKFGEPRPIQSESEKLDALQKRKELGLNTAVELIMKDNPDLTEDQAKEKLKKIVAEKAEELAKAMVNQPEDPNAPPPKVEDPKDEE